MYLLETTPKEIIIIAMLLSMSYIARSEIEVLARLAVIIYPIVIVIPILLIIVTMPNTDYTNIFPVFQLDFPSLLRGTLMGLFSFGGYEFLLLSLPMVEDQEETLKSSLKGMSIVIIIYLLIFFITLSQYGIHQLKREIWPSIAIVKEISLPGYFLENLDGIFVAAWLMVVFGTLGPILHFTGVLLTEILNTKEHQYLILPIIPIIYMVSQYHKNLAQFVKNMVQIFNYFTIFTIMIMPTILFIIAAIKKRRENQ